MFHLEVVSLMRKGAEKILIFKDPFSKGGACFKRGLDNLIFYDRDLKKKYISPRGSFEVVNIFDVIDILSY